MTSIRLKGILPTIGRIILSVSVLVVGWGILSLTTFFHMFINQEPNSSAAIPHKAAFPIASIAAPPKRSSLWPQFPIHGSIAAHELTLNGTPITIEEWESSAPARSILDYYEIQMMARGWRDGLKEVRSLADEAAAQLNQNGESITASQFLQSRQPNGDLCLELQRPRMVYEHCSGTERQKHQSKPGDHHGSTSAFASRSFGHTRGGQQTGIVRKR